MVRKLNHVNDDSFIAVIGTLFVPMCRLSSAGSSSTWKRNGMWIRNSQKPCCAPLVFISMSERHSVWPRTRQTRLYVRVRHKANKRRWGKRNRRFLFKLQTHRHVFFVQYNCIKTTKWLVIDHFLFHSLKLNYTWSGTPTQPLHLINRLLFHIQDLINHAEEFLVQ